MQSGSTSKALAEANEGHLYERKYDVFLSFRGADTRKGFTDHLYHNLIEANIHTYKDDKEMEYGQEIESACLKAIEESEFCIIIFSKTFATSTWCLKELEHILESKKPEQIWSMFYDVDPSEVEHQTGSFQKAFDDYTEKFKEDPEKFKEDIHRVNGWRKALSTVVNFKAFVIKNCEDGHEARNIRNIVKEISNKLGSLELQVALHPVGLERPVSEVIELLGNLSGDKCIISIYGVGGIGKSTIAKKVYNSIANEFNGSSFLENVSERLSQNPRIIAELHSQLLSDVLKIESGKISVVNLGLSLVEKRLQGRKLLIILDGLDKVDHLHQIIGTGKWLFSGSRVIITTKIENFPNPTSIAYKEYEVMELNHQMSLQLLCLHAFGEISPPEKYANCAHDILLYSGGVPLVLIVLGSSLRNQDVDVWNYKLEKLKVIAHKHIQKVLENYITLFLIWISLL